MKIKSLSESQKERCSRIFYNVLIPLILLLYPLCKSAVGVDYMDSMYSPGNFVFFQEMEGTWVIATYLANVIGFLITCREGVDRNKVVQYVEKKGVQTRMLFAGNLIKHPCFDEMRKTGEGYRVVGSLDNTERIMRDTFWVGVYPGMTDEKIDYMAKVIKEGLEQ